MRLSFVLFAAIVALVAAGWLSDVVTLQGERTIYTVSCADGTWQGTHCSGRLAPAERYRYRALGARGEVLFWVIGANEPSSKFTSCAISDGRNWTCKPTADAAKSITLQMSHGEAMHDPTGQARSFHAVPKWRWLLASYGLSLGSDAKL